MPEKYITPQLPYAYDALEPSIDRETMMIHHDKHHVAYTTKLNEAVEKHPALFEKNPVDLLRDLASVPEDIRPAVRNNGGGHVNHSLFWEIMGPHAGGEPSGILAEAIKETFGSFAQFKEQFAEAAKTQFGSGWAWLTVTADKKLQIEKTANQDTPLSEGRTPILALDVWEHAYYLKYRNVRPDYIAAWWNVVNWEAVAKRYQA
ncbi:MAG: superoxide dismutase [Candidatus Kerfeldbacteria bacterium]|nr:superoxide dismutase [Candidatus Kerfeldbacteria bacterium]